MSGKLAVAALGAICLALAIAGNASRTYYVYPAPSVGGFPPGYFHGIGLWEIGSGRTKYDNGWGVWCVSRLQSPILLLLATVYELLEAMSRLEWSINRITGCSESAWLRGVQ